MPCRQESICHDIPFNLQNDLHGKGLLFAIRHWDQKGSLPTTKSPHICLAQSCNIRAALINSLQWWKWPAYELTTSFTIVATRHLRLLSTDRQLASAAGSYIERWYYNHIISLFPFIPPSSSWKPTCSLPNSRPLFFHCWSILTIKETKHHIQPLSQLFGTRRSGQETSIYSL